MSYIKMGNGDEYILIEWRQRAYEYERRYTLHMCDVEGELIDGTPMLEFRLPLTQKNRYAPYFRSFFPLLVYAISNGVFLNSKKKKIKVGFDHLDIIYKNFILDYEGGVFDSQGMVAPDIGAIIQGIRLDK